MSRKSQKIVTFAVLLVLLPLLAYVGYQVSVVLDRPYITETAIRYTMSDSIYSDGFLVFDQQEVPGDGMIGYLVKSGERVPAGRQVAEQYSSLEQADARRELVRLEEQMELLKKSENTAAVDVSVLLSERQSAFYNFMDELEQKHYAAAEEESRDYLLALNRLQITTGEIADFDAARSGVEARQQEALARLGSPEAITAPVGGYFVAASAADWLAYDEEQLSAMSPEAMQSAFDNGEGVRSVSGAGKLVKSYAWHFYGSCTLEESEKFEGVSQVMLSFPGEAEKRLPARVERVEKDEASGLARIVLRCEYVGADVLGLAAATARIDFEFYEGIRINPEALHIVKVEDEDGNEDYARGVYTKNGSIARFRKIKILYQNEDYILVPEDGKLGTDNEVRLFDEIIVKGVDLADGKLLK